jgi:CheY-like chemotaxis protein
VKKAATRPGGETWPAMAPRARILLVDDDERNLLALSEVLEPLAEVVTATSGRLALRELLKDDFAVILLDVFMPEMDGYETAALIRQR